MFVFPNISYGQTIEELQAQINDLLQLVQELQAQIAAESLSSLPAPEAPPAPETSSCASPDLTRALFRGLNDSVTKGEVSQLQRFLSQFPQIYPAGLITGFFGPLTEQSVKQFQAQYGVVSSGSPETTGYGVVGPKTRVAIKDACSESIPVIPEPPVVSTPPVIVPTPTPEILSTSTAQAQQLASMPDLAIDNIDFAIDPLFPGDIQTIVVTVKNLGEAGSGTYTIFVYDQEHSWGGTIHNAQVPQLGGERQYILRLSLPQQTVAQGDTYFFTATVDSSEQIQESDEENNQATSSFRVGIPPDVDEVPPVRSNPVSSNIDLDGNSFPVSLIKQISFNTDEKATCKYATSPEITFLSMKAIKQTGGFSHVTSVSGITTEGTYLYYVRCQDTAGNTNTDDFTISFLIEDLAPPRSFPGYAH